MLNKKAMTASIEKDKKNPSEVDTHVGKRIRLRRTALKMSQTQLGEHLGLTFQQVQKYESGSNRVSASRLMEISKALNVSVSYFFDDLQVIEGGGTTIDESIKFTPEICKLINAFALIKSSEKRRKILELVILMG